MRFLSVAERELRVTARRAWYYRARGLTALAFLGLLIWLAWVFDLGSNRRAATNLFEVYSVFVFFYCLLVGTASTADCLSRERREGTLGLLFLTNLSSLEIIIGKIASSSLTLFYSLLAIFPLLALPLLFGGITAMDFWCTILALVNGLWFAMAMGFIASAWCVRQFPAVAFATSLALCFGAGWVGLMELLELLGWPSEITDLLKLGCPLKSLMASAHSRGPFARTEFWQSLTAVAALSTICFLMVSWRIAWAWRDRPKRPRAQVRKDRPGREVSPARVAFRRRLLNINPFLWLASRQRVSAPVYMAISSSLILLTVWVTGPYFERVLTSGSLAAVAGHTFAWMWTGLALHVLTLYYAAAAASQRLAEDRQTGALELVLATSTDERTISRGLWLAYGRRMLFPIVLVTLVHFYFIWQGAFLFTVEPIERLPNGTTPGELLWAALTDGTIRGQRPHWAYGFMLQILLLVWGVFALAWVALGWLGRWLGLSLKRPGFAPLLALGMMVIPPIVAFSVCCYLADDWEFDRLPERFFLPLMLWIGFVIFAGHFMALALWAGLQLRSNFRAQVISRDLPETRRARWRTNGKVVLRFAAGLAAMVFLSGVIGYGFFAKQNAQSLKRWAAFQKAQGDSLRLTNALPPLVPEAENFAAAPAFQSLLRGRSPGNALPTMAGANTPIRFMVGYTPADPTVPWIRQTRLTLLLAEPGAAGNQQPGQAATNNGQLVRERLRARAAELEGITRAAEERSEFVPQNRRDRMAVLQSDLGELHLLETVHGSFVLRACTRLATGDASGAARDTVTSLRLARFGGESLDLHASLREQVLAGRSIQPVWEGLADRVWKESELAEIQAGLSQINVLATYTNNVQRLVLAHMELWDQFGHTPRLSPLSGAVTYRSRDRWQPRGWWLDCAIDLHEMSRDILANINPDRGWLSTPRQYGNFYELPLDSESQQMLQQPSWWGASFSTVAFAQTAVNQAIIACALERYRLGHGSFPESLDALVPAYLARLPTDVLSGRPLNYEPKNETYQLRGVGPNLRIDRQQTVSDDWLWSFGTNAPAGK